MLPILLISNYLKRVQLAKGKINASMLSEILHRAAILVTEINLFVKSNIIITHGIPGAEFWVSSYESATNWASLLGAV